MTLAIYIVCALLLAASGQDTSDRSQELSSEPPCYWSDEFVEWLSQLQPYSGHGPSEPAKPPTKLRDVVPDFPEDTLGRRNLGGRPFVEAVIDDEGKVLEARLIERIEWEPAWPEFDKAILDAVRQWEFEPTTVGDRPVWVCMSVSITLNWARAPQSVEEREAALSDGRRTSGSSRRTAGRNR